MAETVMPLIGILVLFAVVVFVILGVVVLTTVSPETRNKLLLGFGVAIPVVLIGVLFVGWTATEVRHGSMAETHSRRLSYNEHDTVIEHYGADQAASSHVDPSKYLIAPSDEAHGGAISHVEVFPVWPRFTWASLSAMSIVAIGAMLFVLVFLRKVEAFVFWKTQWKPAGAVASAAALATAGSVFVLKTPNPAHTPMFSESPSFETFLERRFGQGSGNSGFSELIEMASDPDLSESEARVSDATVIGRLPYGKPNEPNSNYSDNFVFTAGHAGAPAAEGVWAPLICNDEIYRINTADSLNRTLTGAETELVSHVESEPIPDDAVVIIGQPESVRLSAIASGQFTTVREAWDDVLAKLRKRAAEEHPTIDSKYYAEMATRGLHNAVTRLAVSRRPLILESELNGEIVEPMYRVHISIDDAGWDRTIDPRSFAMGQGRERSMILIVVLSALTLGIGMLGGRKQSVEVSNAA